MALNLGTKWKALIAVGGVVGTGLLTVASDPNVIAAVPTGWPAAVLAAGAAVTGYVAWGKRNQMTLDQIDAALKAGDITLSDLKTLLPKANESS